MGTPITRNNLVYSILDETMMKEKIGCVYLEFKNKGVIKHKAGSTEYVLELEYKRLLEQIRRGRKILELEKGHVVLVDNLVEILIRYD